MMEIVWHMRMIFIDHVQCSLRASTESSLHFLYYNLYLLHQSFGIWWKKQYFVDQRSLLPYHTLTGTRTTQLAVVQGLLTLPIDFPLGK